MSNKSTPTTPINDNKWWAGLIIFGFISLLCFAWLAYSLLQVTDYISDVNQLEISSTNIVKDVNDATFSRDFEISRAAYAKLSGDIQDYEAALTRLQGNSLMGHGSTFKELNEAWLAQNKTLTLSSLTKTTLTPYKTFKSKSKTRLPVCKSSIC